MAAVAQSEDWQVQYVPCRWEECLQQVNAGKLDLMMDVAYSPERAQQYRFNQQVALASWSVIYSRYGSSIYSLPDLDGQRIAVLANSIQYDLIVEQAQAFDIEPVFIQVSDFASMFRRLAEGSVDAGTVNHFYQVPSEFRSKIRQTNIVLAPAQLHFIASPSQVELLEVIDRHLVVMKRDANSAYAAAYGRWLEPETGPAQAELMRRMAAIATIVFLVLLGFILLVWNQTLSQEIRRRQHSEARLQASESSFRSLAANVPGALMRYRLTADGSEALLYVSPGCYDIWEINGQTCKDNVQALWDMVLPEDRQEMYQSILNSAKQLTPWLWEWRICTPSGQLKWLQGIGKPDRQTEGTTVWDSFIADITARKHAEASLRESESRYRLLADSISDLVCLHAPRGTFLYISPSIESLLGYTSNELLGTNPYDLVHPEDCDRMRQQARTAVLNNDEPCFITARIRTKADGYIWMETLIKVIRNQEGQIVQLQTTSREVTERVRAQEQLRYDSLHDSLTGLPNRAFLIKQIRQILQQSNSSPTATALMFLDLDRFKVINDSLGHLVGDRLLVLVAQQLQQALREGDVAARLGGDEFMVLVYDLQDINDAVQIAKRLIQALELPFLIQGREVFVSPSIGIVQVAAYHQQTTDLLRDADIAMYRAKHRGGNRYEIFNRSMHQEAVDRLELESDLRRALDKQELYLLYQPLVELKTGRLFGFESLLRWHHPRRGVISPSQFIPIAEETGLILPIGRWVLQQVCQQLGAWQQITPMAQQISICVNCSAKQLQSGDFLDWLEAQMQLMAFCRGQISLEITESLWIEDLETTVEKLHRLKQQHIGISIDDFGTGYSSLSYLSQLPIDMLKIDRAFISHLQERYLNQEIVTAILALSDPLSVRAVAEGIETTQQLRWLRHLGCDIGQGYLFAEPLAPEAALGWIQSDPCFDMALQLQDEFEWPD